MQLKFVENRKGMPSIFIRNRGVHCSVGTLFSADENINRNEYNCLPTPISSISFLSTVPQFFPSVYRVFRRRLKRTTEGRETEENESPEGDRGGLGFEERGKRGELKFMNTSSGVELKFMAELSLAPRKQRNGKS